MKLLYNICNFRHEKDKADPSAQRVQERLALEEKVRY